MRVLSYCIIGCLIFVTIGSGNTIQVPSQKPTIQAGIDAASEGDTVLVASGTHTGDGNRDIDFGGKDIVVISESGPEVTIIDCEGTGTEPHRGFYFHSSESHQAVVEGFTIINGYAEDGGGVSCVNSSPSIRDNIVTNCTAVHYGAGIHCVYSTSQIIGNAIFENTGSDIGGDGGGGISLIYCNNVLIADNTISGNFSYSGGGVDCFDASATIRHNTIEANLAHGGAAISLCCGSSGTIDSNTLVDNLAYDGGGGAIYCNSGSDPLISNNVILGNMGSSPFSRGGGICCNESDPDILGNTIVGNSAANGGGLAFINYASPRVQGNIVALSGSGGAVLTETTTSPAFAHCDLWGNNGGDWTASIAGQLGLAGNMSVDPMFCDADNGDYHLSILSPCAATNNSSGSLIGALEANCGSRVCGDVDLDGELTLADIDALATAYFGPRLLYFPTPNGDMDCSGTIGLNDLVILAGYYYGYGPAPCCVPQPKRPVKLRRDIVQQF